MQINQQSLSQVSLVENYRDFMSQDVIRDFIQDGGRVHIATEKRPFAIIEELYAEGHRHFSEKFVQETLKKWPNGRRKDVVLHGYGRLQRNKARRACGLFSVIESLGQDSLLKKLSQLSDEGVMVPAVVVQVNTGHELQKNGYSRADADSAIDRSLTLGLNVVGVMAIPPRNENPRDHYRWLKQLSRRHGLSECIMGMTDDYQIAIEEGSTAIRVGRAIFGNA